MRPRTTRTRIGTHFSGEATPVGSTVEFNGPRGAIRGKVAELRPRYAIVKAGDAGRWKVAYRQLRTLRREPGNGRSLRDMAAGAARLMQNRAPRLTERGWTFGYELTTSRAGACRYHEREINLSVSFALKAADDEIIDTVLHEIAHALAGPNTGHGREWQRIARQIGCSAKRCSTTVHTPGRWIGSCACRTDWRRQRLTDALRRRARCPRCRTRITWRTDTGEATA